MMPSFSAGPVTGPSSRLPEEGALFSFDKLDFRESDVAKRYDNIMGPLSLFAPFPHEDHHQKGHKVDLERPITPIDDEIKQPPRTFNKLAKLVRRRISAKPEVEHLAADDQKELAAIIMGEVNGIWPDIRMQVDDPFLTTEENKELQRRITVHIVTVCEHLFRHYLDKAQILQKRGVFSGPANMSRLKAQLGLDANKFLNILTIRRYIVEDLRHRDVKDTDQGKKAALPQHEAPMLSYKALIEASRPKSKAPAFRCTSPSSEIRDMVDDMPGINTTKLVEIMSEVPKLYCGSSLDSVSMDEAGFDIPLPRKTQGRRKTEPSVAPIQATRMTEDEMLRSRMLLKKCDSVPHLEGIESLREELGLETGRRSAASLADEAVLCGADQVPRNEETHRPQPGTREYVQEDLKKLARKREDEDEVDDDDLAPLLQALTQAAKHDHRRETLDRQLQDLERREEERIERERLVLQEASHPQPATISTKLPNKMVVRTSDIRVSERVCLSSITLQKNETVYNDIIDEIDPATVKKLDSNLFLGDEISEVYREIMKTVPTDHLNLENDSLVVPAADSVDLTSALASGSLSKRPSERIINKKLQQQTEPPWGGGSVRDWSRTPANPPRDVRGRPLILPLTPRGDGRSQADFFGEGYVPPAAEVSAAEELRARSYSSWLQWWKNLVNTDDYMKYVSTQETDYMGVIFHFYNSEDEDGDDVDDDEKKSLKRSRQLMEEERQKQLAELRDAKAEYKEGFWNVNSVLLGGLGKDPLLSEDSMEKEKSLTVDDPTSQPKLGHNRTQLVSRRSLKVLHSQTSIAESARGVASPRSLSRPGTKISSTPSGRSKDEAPPSAPSAQDRLEKVWSQLRMPDKQKLDMAIKYSSDQFHRKLDEAIDAWERATTIILQREELFLKLEQFERLASDPNRFFEKGFRGSSVARLEEAKIRSAYYKKIETYDHEIRCLLDEVQNEYQDTITYQGRPYRDKIQWDRTEMLYWLQEERKQQAMDYERQMRNLPPLPLKLTHVAPINPQTTSVK